VPDRCDGHYEHGELWQSRRIVEFLDGATDAGVVYQLMVAVADATITDVGLRLGWPADRVDRALDQLRHLSLIRRSSETPSEFRLVSPAVGLAPLLAETEAALVKHELSVADSRTAAARLIAEYAKVHETRRFESAQELIGLDMIQLSAEELARNCISEVMAFTPGGSQTQEHMNASRPQDQALLERGIRFRILYLDSIINDPPTVAYALWLKEMGGVVRTIPCLPARMAIYDRRIAVVAPDPEQNGNRAVLVHGTGLLPALCALFDQSWMSSLELGAPRQRDQGGLTAQEREILRLLADGCTDSVVARKLGISVRTAQRLVTELASRLGARSRFQIGMRALEAGWLDSDESAVLR
jgi:DNA-binding CsgD family transcriptional regulator